MDTADTEFEGPEPTKLGRPRTEIPETLAELLEASYTLGRHRPVTISAGQRRMATGVVRLARIYARRQHKTLRWQLDGDRLWLAMADKRTYTKKDQ